MEQMKYKVSTKIVRFMLCPSRASFVTHSFTQGVAIGLDLFKPFQGFSRGYHKSVPIISVHIVNTNYH